MSKWATFVESELVKVFDLKYGQWNCRPISGTDIWSQHSWGNALDLVHEDYGYSRNPDHQAELDLVFEWLQANSEALSIRLILWRRSGHYDHIHIDGWPTGYETPPCADGTLRMLYPKGTHLPRVVYGDPGPMNGTDPIVPGDDMPSYEELKASEFDLWTDQNIMDAFDAGMFESTDRAGFADYWVRDQANRTVSEKARFMTDYYAHLWK